MSNMFPNVCYYKPEDQFSFLIISPGTRNVQQKCSSFYQEINASWNHRVNLRRVNVIFYDLNFQYFGPKFSMHSIHSWHSERKSGGTPNNSIYWDGQHERAKFQVSGIWKGKDFTSAVELYERVWKSVISVCREPQRLTDVFYGCEKINKTFLWYTVHLQLLKGVQSSKLGMWKGYHLQIEGGAFPNELLLNFRKFS